MSDTQLRAVEILRNYKKAQAELAKKPPLSTELQPIVNQLVALLQDIANKEVTPPVVENVVNSPEVTVNVPEMAITNDVKLPEFPAAAVNVELTDYSKLLSQLNESVIALAKIVANRPVIWEVKREKGLIDRVEGVT